MKKRESHGAADADIAIIRQGDGIADCPGLPASRAAIGAARQSLRFRETIEVRGGKAWAENGECSWS